MKHQGRALRLTLARLFENGFESTVRRLYKQIAGRIHGFNKFLVAVFSERLAEIGQTG